MLSRLLPILLLLVGAKIASGKESKIFINVGVGPALHLFPGAPLEVRPLLPGLAMEFFAVVPRETIQSNLKRIKSKKTRNMAKGVDEVRFTPLWLQLVPDRLIIAPGDSLQVYGATFTFFGGGISLISTRDVKLSLAGRLPTVTYNWFRGPALEKERHTLGFGISPGAKLEWFVNSNFVMEIGYRHNLFLQSQINRLTMIDGERVDLQQQGTIHLLLHKRIPRMVKL